jgi:hypothetical protein
MVQIARPLAAIRLSGGASSQERWEPGEHRVDVRLFGFPPVGCQTIAIHLLPEEGGARQAEELGCSPLIRRWQHIIQVAAGEAGATCYTDRLNIDAVRLPVCPRAVHPSPAAPAPPR